MFKSAFRVFLGLLLTLFATSQAFAWGGLGHRATGHIAQTYLTPQARQAVQVLLQGQSLSEVASWADAIRDDPAFGHAAWYHFDKIADGFSYLQNLKNLPPQDRAKGGVMQAILLSERILEDKSRRRGLPERAMALKFLVHFIGDMHQPLHTGRPQDKGGNTIPVNWFNTQTSLHGVWDAGIIMVGHADLFKDLPPTADFSVPYARYLLERFKPNLPPQTRDNPEAWMNESLQVRPLAYHPDFENNQKAYLGRNLPIVGGRVYLAGLRIADTLNRIFASAPPAPVQMTFMRAIEDIVGRLDKLITLGPRAGQPNPPGRRFGFGDF